VTYPGHAGQFTDHRPEHRTGFFTGTQDEQACNIREHEQEVPKYRHLSGCRVEIRESRITSADILKLRKLSIAAFVSLLRQQGADS
jgi:hypothetical protein